jgi:hypothetical protein
VNSDDLRSNTSNDVERPTSPRIGRQNYWPLSAAAEVEVNWLSTAITSLARFPHANMSAANLMRIAADVTAQVQTLLDWWLELQRIAEQIEHAEQRCTIRGPLYSETARPNRRKDPGLSLDWSALALPAMASASFALERQQFSEKFSEVSLGSKTNALYDAIALQRVVMNDFFSEVRERFEQVSELATQLDLSNDVDIKTGLASQLVSERSALQQSCGFHGALQNMLRQELITAATEAATEW